MTSSTTERGYGAPHKAERETWAPVIAAGHGWCAEVVCLMSSRYIAPDMPWDLAHADTRHTYRGPAHVKCNRSEGAVRGNRARNAPPSRWVL